MLTIDHYLDLARARQGFASDSRLSHALDLGRQAVSFYRTRRAWPSDKAMMKLADLAGMDVAEALLHLNVWRNESAPVRAQYAQMISAIKRTASVVALLLTFQNFPLQETKLHTQAPQNFGGIYIMQSGERLCSVLHACFISILGRILRAAIRKTLEEAAP